VFKLLASDTAVNNNGQQVTANTTALCKSAGYKLVLTYLSPYKDRCEAVDQPVAAIGHRTAGCKSNVQHRRHKTLFPTKIF
jgi:hypothetical protein